MKKLAAAGLLIVASCAVNGRPLDEELLVVPLKNASAEQVCRTLKAECKAQPGGLTELVADTRTNAIVAKGTKGELGRLERRIRELDVR